MASMRALSTILDRDSEFARKERATEQAGAKAEPAYCLLRTSSRAPAARCHGQARLAPLLAPVIERVLKRAYFQADHPLPPQ